MPDLHFGNKPTSSELNCWWIYRRLHMGVTGNLIATVLLQLGAGVGSFDRQNDSLTGDVTLNKGL